MSRGRFAGNCERRLVRKALLAFAALLVIPSSLLIAGQTGKIAGRILSAGENDPMVGANVIVQGTYLGAATDLDGFYTINNVPPGTYTVAVTFVGYRKYSVTNVQVRIDLTTRVDAKLVSEAIQTDEIVVRAERPIVQKDLTSSSVTVSAEELQRLPTEDISQVINLQAGVVAGHFRGGRSDEVAYLIDGVSVTDPFNGGMSVQVENSSIREMEIISGTFNAEYGQVMSGVVNIVTPDGGSTYHGSISGYTGDYFTNHTDVFPNVGTLSKFRTQNAQGSFSGPFPGLGDLSFFLTGRYFNDAGYLYGRRVYNITDRSPHILTNAQGVTIVDANGNPVYIMTQTGDGAFVPMNPYTRWSGNGKLSYNMRGLKLSYSVFVDKNWNKYYDHSFAWTPDGIMNHYRTDWVHSFQVTHDLSSNTYQTLKISGNDFDYKGYLYADQFDPRYVDPSQGTPISGYTFRSGGNQGDRYDRHTRTYIGQWAITSQVSPKHKLGAGAEVRFDDIYNHNMSMMNVNTTVFDSTTQALMFELGYPQLGAPNNQAYRKKPFEFSAFVQDKAEYELMIINAGLRFDYFNPRSSYPLDLRNPGYPGNPLFPGAGLTQRAKAKVQVSPRLGISFPITDNGIIHFSYGHFFQIPDFSNLYVNSDYLIPPSSNLSYLTGNPDLEAQRRVQYEVGLQQVLFNNVGMEFTVYYSDIRNLLGMEIINTYDGRKYARYVNRDYANVKGFILSLDRRLADYFGVKLDYTFQVAGGDASDPMSVFYNNQTSPPVETNKTMVPLNWDQRHTLNLSLTVGKPGDWNVGTVFQYGSGWPYTEDIRVSQGVRFENGGQKPATFNVDMRAEKTFSWNQLNFTVFALVYNLLDVKNEYSVNAASGRANIDLYTYLSGPVIGLNTIPQYVNDPSSFSAPRQVRLGATVDF
jgi:outer membrane receptor protein involved in Fe transport